MTKGERLTTLRMRMGRLTQREFGRLFDAVPQKVCQWEKDQVSAPLDLIGDVAHDLGVSLEWLHGKSETFCRPGYDDDMVKAAVRKRLDQPETQTA